MEKFDMERENPISTYIQHQLSRIYLKSQLGKITIKTLGNIFY
jgi:hypothetical protein